MNESAYGSHGAEAVLDTYLDKNVEVEHILPQNPCSEASSEFGDALAAEENTQRLGNLTLVEKPINASLGNKAYSDKREVYGKSKFLLTGSLAGPTTIGVNTSVDRMSRQLRSYPNWTPESVTQRQRELGRLARIVWEVPKSAAVGSEAVGTATPVESVKQDAADIPGKVSVKLREITVESVQPQSTELEPELSEVFIRTKTQQTVFDYVTEYGFITSSSLANLTELGGTSANVTASKNLKRWSDPERGFLERDARSMPYRYRIRTDRTVHPLSKSAGNLEPQIPTAAENQSGPVQVRSESQQKVYEYLLAHGSITSTALPELLDLDGQYANINASNNLRIWSSPAKGFLARDESTMPFRYHIRQDRTVVPWDGTGGRSTASSGNSTSARGRVAEFEAMLREHLEVRLSVDNQDCRELFGLGQSNSAKTRVSQYLRRWCGEDGFLRREGNPPAVRYYLRNRE